MVRTMRVPLALVAWLLASIGGTAGAATLTVTDLGDTGEPGQLRTLISEAVRGDVILIPEGTITLALEPAGDDGNVGGDLDIFTTHLAIQGAGADRTFIDGARLDRVFHIQGVIASLSRLTIRNGRVTALGGGGVYIDPDASLTLTEVIVRDSTASTKSGGGILNNGSLKMVDSAVIGNSADGAGGGILNAGSMRLVNVTVSGNQSGYQGGGVDQILVTSTAALEHVTISDNTGDRDVNTFGAGGLTNEEAGELTLRNTIVAGNRRGAGSTRHDCWGQFTTLGHNLIGQTEPCVVIGVPAGDLFNQPADLGPLAANGGPTPTHALLPGSLAIDAAGGDCPSTDQRRVLRPQGPQCDIGAYERGGTVPVAVDFDGDGRGDVVVGAGRGSDPRVAIISGASGEEIRSFLAYEDGRRGGVRVAACDLNADGVPDIVTAPGDPPVIIRVFDGRTGNPFPPPLGAFEAFSGTGRATGAHVGCLDVDGDGVPDILVGTGAGAGGDARLLTFSGVDGSPLATIIPFGDFRGDLYVAP